MKFSGLHEQRKSDAERDNNRVDATEPQLYSSTKMKVNCGKATASTTDGPRGMYRERKDHVRPHVIVGTEIDVTNRVTKQI